MNSNTTPTAIGAGSPFPHRSFVEQRWPLSKTVRDQFTRNPSLVEIGFVGFEIRSDRPLPSSAISKMAEIQAACAELARFLNGDSDPAGRAS